jgi:tetratricopeptide (TPR) repeat protein
VLHASSYLLQVLQLLVLLMALGLVVAIVRWLNHSEPGFVAPFADATGGGLTAVNDLLAAKLDRIAAVQNRAVPEVPGERLRTAPVRPNPETIDTSLANVGTVSVGGQATVSIGQALLTLKRLWPIGGRGTTISGSVQRYWHRTHLVATVQWHRGTTVIAVEGPVTSEARASEPIPAMVCELAYRIHFAVAGSRMEAGTWKQLQRFTEAREAYLGYLDSKRLEDLKRALELTQRAYEQDCAYVRLFGLFYGLGLAYFSSDDYECAARQFRIAQTIHARQPQVFVQQARCLFAQGWDYEALEVLNRIPDRAPDWHPMKPYMRGLILGAMGRHAPAIEALRSVPQRPRSLRSAAWVTMAGLYDQQGEPWSCDWALQHVAEGDFDGDAYSRACWLSVRSRGRDDHDREHALECLREALADRLMPLRYAKRDPDLHHLLVGGEFQGMAPLPCLDGGMRGDGAPLRR